MPRKRGTRLDKPKPPTSAPVAGGSDLPSDFTLRLGEPALNARKRIFLRAVIDLMREGYSRGLSRHQVCAAVRRRWPHLPDRVLYRPYSAMVRMYAIDLYGKSEKDQRLDVLVVLDQIVADPFSSAADRIAALKEKSKILGLNAPLRVQQEIAAKHEHIHTIREVAQRDERVRELWLQLGRRLTEAAAVGEAQSCCN